MAFIGAPGPAPAQLGAVFGVVFAFMIVFYMGAAIAGFVFAMR
jgi:hypothetical protein